MFKFIASNWREAIALVFFIGLLFVGILALGQPIVSESSELSAGVSLAVALMGGVAKFFMCLALAWLGLAITLPEAAKHIFGNEFDGVWNRCPSYVRFYVALGGAAVLAIVAALCMAA